MRRFASLSLFVALVLPAASVEAQFCSPAGGGSVGWSPAGSGTPGCVPLNMGLGGPAGFGAGILNRNDDLSTGAIDLRPAFPGGLHFYGGPYNTMYVNNNGNITFNGTLFTYTPRPFPLPAPTPGMMPAPMIAPYWGDVDTRNAAGLATPNDNLVYYDVRLGQVTVTWYQVGYFSNLNGHRMSFQLILRNGSGCGMGDFDVEFRYNRCEWMAGTASGDRGDGQCMAGVPPCTPANVGFDADDGRNFVQIPEALTRNIENVCIMSNVGTPGIYQFGVRGGSIVCSGGGTVCMVAGQVGQCGIGVNACHGTGVMCQQVFMPSPEICDNIDNNCDGMVDNGSGLCPGSQVCVNGTCVSNCLDGGCAMGFTCLGSGACVEDSCVVPGTPATARVCPANQRCVHGMCVDGCTGVVCPHGQQCIGGGCVDLCSLLRCDAGSVCQAGQCVAMCPCNPCPAGSTCNADGTCSSTGCDIVTCQPGFYCMAGTCLDGCAGVVCPGSQTCVAGTCTQMGMPDSGVPVGDSGLGFVTDSGRRDAGGGMRDGGGADGGRGPHVTRAGCGCRVERGTEALGTYAMLALLGLVIARRRRSGRS